MSGLRFALAELCLEGEAVQPGEPFITLQSRRHHHVASAWVSKRDGRGLEAMIGTHKHGGARSEEHTSELQSLMRISYAVFCLKKKNNDNIMSTSHRIQSNKQTSTHTTRRTTT